MKKYFSYQKVPFTFSAQIPIGIEIEFEGAKLSSLQERLSIYENIQNSSHQVWHAKKDSSVSRILPNDFRGGEIVSPIFYNKSKDIYRLKRILQILKEEKATIGELSSLQVSIDLSIFENNPIYLQNFFILYSLFEAEVYRFSCANRDSLRESAATFALPLGDHLLYLLDTSNLVDSDFSSYLTSLQQFLRGDGNCFYGLFLEQEVNQNGRNRLEFRTCNTSFEERIVFNIINFFVHLVLASKRSSFKDILSFIKPFWNTEIKPFLSPFPSSISCSFYHDSIFHATENLEKANYFANILYTTSKEKELFLKQYTKKM